MPPEDTTPEMVPYARLAEVTGKLRAAEQALQQAESRFAAAERRLNEQFTELQAAHQAERDQWEQTSLLQAQGLDPASDDTKQLLDYVRWKHSALQVEEGQERPSFSEYFGTLRQSDRVVQSYFSDPPRKPATPPTAQPKPPPKDPAANGGDREQPPPVPGRYTPADIARMSPEEFRANREAIFGQISGVVVDT